MCSVFSVSFELYFLGQKHSKCEATQLFHVVHLLLVCREHEWLKHGTCSDFSDEHSFFSTVLNIGNDLAFGRILSQSGIEPSKAKKMEVSDETG